jgi:trehalose synthase
MLQILGARMNKKSFLHVNSTRAGGGVAEILQSMIPILEDLGIQARWEVIEGDEKFFEITKKIHNAIQGRNEEITEEMWQHHHEINRRNAAKINLEADAVLIHD